MDADGGSGFFSGGEDSLQHGFEFCGSGVGAVGLFHLPEKVIGTDEDGIDSGQAVDGFRVVDSFGRFGLQDDENFVVCAAVVLAGFRLEVLCGDTATDGAIALGRVFGGGDGDFRLFDGIDHGDDDTPGAAIEDSFDQVVVTAGDASEWHATSVGDGSEHEGGHLPVDGRVFKIDGEPWEAGFGHQASGEDITEGEPGADGRFAGLQIAFYGVDFHERASRAESGSGSGVLQDQGRRRCMLLVQRNWSKRRMLVGLLIAGGGRRIREAVNSVPAGMLHFGTSENCGNSLFYPVCQRMWIRVADAGFRGLSFPWNSEFQRRLPGELAGCRVWWELVKGVCGGFPKASVWGGRVMWNSMWLACVLMVLQGSVAWAGICGAGSYRCCPVEACAATGSYTACRVQTVTAWKTVCETVYEPEEYTAKKVVYEPVYEAVEQTTYRVVQEMSYRDEEYTVCRPVTQQATRTETYCVRRPVTETRWQTRQYTVRKPIWEDRVRECRYTVQQPVCETVERECRRTVLRCQTKTVEQERCWTVLKPETRTRTVQRMSGQWQQRVQTIPGAVTWRMMPGPLGFQFCPVQCPPRQVTRRVWCPQTVCQEVPYTVMVPQVVRQKCPVQVTQYVPEVQVQKIPVQVTRMVSREVVQKVLYRVCRVECETKSEQVPYTVCRMVTETKSREVPYTVCRMVSETKTRRVPVCVEKRLPCTSTRQVCRMVPKEVEVRACRMVPKQIIRQIPCAERVLVRELVQFPAADPAGMTLGRVLPSGG